MNSLEQIVELVGAQMPLYKKQIAHMLKTLTDEERAEGARTMAFFTERMGYSQGDLADAYIWFLRVLTDASLDFKRTGKYPHSAFAEIADYYNDAELMKNYVASLAISVFLSPQHAATNRFYKNAVSQTKSLKRGGGGEIFGNRPRARAFARNGDGAKRL